MSPKPNEKRAVFDLGSIATLQWENTRGPRGERGSGQSPGLTYFLVFILVYGAMIEKVYGRAAFHSGVEAK